MATLNGLTPEQLAAQIIEDAQKTVHIEISKSAYDRLVESILRYKHAKKIYSKGDKWFQINVDNFATDWLEKVIEAQADQREKLDAKQEEADKFEYVKLLVSRGVNRYQAMEMAGLISSEDVEAAKKLVEAEAAKVKAAASKNPTK